jgi:hypothetical protein
MTGDSHMVKIRNEAHLNAKHNCNHCTTTFGMKYVMNYRSQFCCIRIVDNVIALLWMVYSEFPS